MKSFIYEVIFPSTLVAIVITIIFGIALGARDANTVDGCETGSIASRHPAYIVSCYLFERTD